MLLVEPIGRASLRPSAGPGSAGDSPSELRSCLMFRLLSLSALLLSSSVVSAVELPNVLMIVADDWGWTDFGFTGHKVIQTPHLDKLAKESALFPNGYVPTSLCRASLATILTGQY